MASNGHSRPPAAETDIPAKPHPSSTKDQAGNPAAAAGVKPHGAPPAGTPAMQHPQGAPIDHLSTGPAQNDPPGRVPSPFQHNSTSQHRAPPNPVGSNQGPTKPYPAYPNNAYGHFGQAGDSNTDASSALAAAAAQAAMLPPAAGGYGPHAGTDQLQHQHQQHPMQDSSHHHLQQQPQLGSPSLPEAAPAPKTDPVELSLLTRYLEVVRQTQGEEAAAQAMAASGLPLDGTNSHTATSAQSPSTSTLPTGSSSAPFPTSASSSAATAPGREHSSSAGTPTAAAAAAAAASLAAEPLALTNLLGFIKQRKLAGVSRQHQRRSSSTSSAHAGGGGGAARTGGAGGTSAQGRKIWIQPSGPRRPGEGVENEEQGILSAEEVPTTGEVMMRITLLAAGFVIGPSGSSVREVVRTSGADINSWTEAAGSHRGRRPARIFLIKGEPSCVSQAVYVVTAAVDRYKELCEGKYSGQSVPRSQNVLGVTFSYQPPPKSIVPCAASLKELYAPPHTLANSARYNVSPPSIYGFNGPHTASSSRAAGGGRSLRGSPPHLPGYPYPHLYERYDNWSAAAMMNAAAAMGMNPLQALAAAGGHHASAAAAAAAAGFGGFGGGLGHMLGPHGPGPAGMMGFGGFEGPLNPLGPGTPPPGAMDPVAAAAAAMPGGLNPYAAAMMGAADAYGAGGGSNNMFGMLLGSTGGPNAAAGGGGSDAEAAAAAAAAAAASSGGLDGGLPGYGPSGNPWWVPGMFDPTGMAALMAGAGLYGQMGGPSGAADNAAADGGRSSTSGEGLGFPPHPMSSAALAAAGLDPAALAAMDGSSVGLGSLHAGLGGPAAGSELSTPTAAAAASEASKAAADAHAAAAGGGGSINEAPGTRDDRRTPPPHPSQHQLQQQQQPHHHRSTAGGSNYPLWPGGLPPPSPFFRGPHLPHLNIPQEGPDGVPYAGGPPPGSPGSARVSRLHAMTHGPGGMPFPPASPGRPLMSFGPLFHPMSPAARPMPPMSPYIGPGGPFGPVPPSPVRLMRDRSGQQIPYMEVGGTMYFAPASPMPPPPTGGTPQHSSISGNGSGHSPQPPAPPAAAPPAEETSQAGEQQQELVGDQPSPAAAAGAAGAAAGSPADDAAGAAPDTIGGRSQQHRPASAGYVGAGGRGDSSSPGRGGSNGSRPSSALRLFNDNPYLTQDAIGSGAASHQPHQVGPNSQQRRQQQQQQWQARHSAGSSNSVAGPNGMHNSRQGAYYGRGNGGSRSPAPPPPPPLQAAVAAGSLASGPKTSPANKQQQHGDAAHAMDQAPADAPPSGAFSAGGRSPSMNELAAAAAAAAAAAGDSGNNNSSSSTAPPAAAGSTAARRTEAWLDAHDPIVSPGRITLASKVKAARLYNTAAAAAGQQGGTGGASPTGA